MDHIPILGRDNWHTRDGKVLLDEKNRCIDFLNNIDKEFARGPKQLTIKEKIFLKDWLQKMLRRAKKGDAEGNFRYHWMLTDALEIYFKLGRFVLLARN